MEKMFCNKGSALLVQQATNYRVFCNKGTASAGPNAAQKKTRALAPAADFTNDYRKAVRSPRPQQTS
jgi:hypothetical protein